MKQPAVLACVATAAACFALETSAEQTNLHNRVSLSYRPGFNFHATFKGLGGYAPRTDPGPATGGAQHYYDDGFNLLDNSGNVGGLTWNWGYSQASQIPGNDTVVMNSSASAGNLSTGDDAGIQHGLELAYNRQLGVVGKSAFGIEIAFNYTRLDVDNSQRLAAPVTVQSDAYALGGITPPLPPYSGSYGGPGPLIGDTPTRSTSTIPGGATVSGSRSLDGSIYGWRLGPYINVPLDDYFTFGLSAGLAVAFIDSEFRFSESVAIPDLPAESRRGYSSDTDWLVGGYVSASLAYALDEHVSLFAGAQFQDIGKYTQTAAGKEVELDLRKCFFVSVGLSYGF